MNFNNEQLAAIESEKPLIVISAGAGSGKTRVLTERYVHICEEKLKERLGKKAKAIAAEALEIVAITFTEKAAREMKDRIRGRIEEKRIEAISTIEDVRLRERTVAFWQEQKEALDSALITTFHSFCHKILHEYAFAANIPPNFTVLDDVQAKLIHIEIFTEMFDSTHHYQKWKKLYQYYTKYQIQEAIISVYSQMKEIVTSDESLNSYFDSETILKLQLSTIENNRKEALIHFYKDSRPYVMELDSSIKAEKAIIDHFSEVTDYSFENPTVLYETLLEAMPKRTNKKWEETAPALYICYEQYFKPLKDEMKAYIEPNEEELAELKEILTLFADMLFTFHQRYDEIKRERAAMDFSDLQQKAIGLLANETIQNNCRRKFRHMMVDEFQDTNQLQMSMLTYIRPDFQFIVGDGKQSIYRFRGADVSLMKEIVDFSKKDTQSDFINMSTNYRTCDSIIQFVNKIFTEIMGIADDSSTPSYKIHYSTIDSNRKSEEEQQCRVEMITVRQPSDESEMEDDLQVTSEEGQSEYEVIVNRMVQMMYEGEKIVASGEEWRAPTWGDFAILIQTRSKLTKLERALKAKQVPYVVYGGIAFYDRQEVRDMLNLLHWLNRPWEPLYILSLLRSPIFGVNIEGFLSIDQYLNDEVSLASYIYEGVFQCDSTLDETLKAPLMKLKNLYEQWIPFTPQGSLRQVLEQLFIDSGLKTSLLLQRNNLQLVKNVEKLIDVLVDFQTASLDDLLEQLKQLQLLSEKEGEAEVELAEGNMVHIMTVHASKGLEFPIVFLPDLAKGIRSDKGSIRFDKDVRIVVQYEKERKEDPLKTPDKKYSPSFLKIKDVAYDQSIEESKRLFYVAVTRAKDYLVLSTVDKPSKNSWYDMYLKAKEETSLEPFIKEIEEVREQEEWMDKGESYSAPSIRENAHELSFSVSEVMTFMNSPMTYYYRYVIKVEDEWIKDDDETRHDHDNHTSISSVTLGTIVHRACEFLDNGFSLEDAKQEALALIEDEDEDKRDRYEQEVARLITNYQQLEQLNLGKTVENEWSFVSNIEGANIIGEIDKIVQCDDGYHIIDLKTNKGNEYNKLAKEYAPQLYLYKMAVEKQYNAPVHQCSLYFMRASIEDGFITLPYETDYEEKVKSAIREMVQLKKSSASKKEYEKILNGKNRNE